MISLAQAKANLRKKIKDCIRIAIGRVSTHNHLKNAILGIVNRVPLLRDPFYALLPKSGHVTAPVHLSERAQEIYMDIKQAMMRDHNKD